MNKKDDRSMYYYALDDFADKHGGTTRLTVLLQKRVRELVKGSPSMVNLDTDDMVQVALEELFQNKIAFVDENDEESLESGDDDKKVKKKKK